jgi:hypothetical protein
MRPATPASRPRLGEYDFMAGVGPHKVDWGAEVKNSRHILLARTSHRNLFFCGAPEWEREARELAPRRSLRRGARTVMESIGTN